MDGMKAARLDDLVERVHRRLIAEPGEVAVQVVLELIAAAALRASHRVEPVDRDRIDHLGAQVAQLAEDAAEDARPRSRSSVGVS